MKILIATGLYPPEIGGPATHTAILERELPKHHIVVRVVAFREARHLPKVLRHIAYFFKIIKRGKDADLIYALDPVSVGLPALFAAKVLGKRFIIRVAGDYAWEQHVQSKISNLKSQKLLTLEEFQDGKYGLLTEIRRRVERYVARSAKKIIVPSKYLKGIVEKWGVDGNKIRVVYSSLASIQRAGNRRTLRGLLKFKGKLIVSAGRLVPWKGFEALIELMPQILKESTNAKLLIIGSGPDEGRLEKRIAECGVKDSVVLTGSLSKSILLRYVEAADIFVLNTSYEGLSHQLLEVMDVGTPIVTTNVGGNSELIEHDGNGLLVPYNDKRALLGAIKRILNAPLLSRRLAENAKKTVWGFSEGKMVKALIKELL